MAICQIFPKFTWCCFCFNLRKGAITIVLLSVILSVLAVGAFTFILTKVDEIDQEDIQENRQFVVDLAIWMIFTNCVAFIIHVFMLIGVVMKKRAWLAVCLWITGMLLVLSFVINFYLIFTGMEHFLFNRETGVRGVFANCKLSAPVILGDFLTNSLL